MNRTTQISFGFLRNQPNQIKYDIHIVSSSEDFKCALFECILQKNVLSTEKNDQVFHSNNYIPFLRAIFYIHP